MRGSGRPLLYFSHHLFEQILERDDTGRSAVLVEDNLVFVSEAVAKLVAPTELRRPPDGGRDEGDRDGGQDDCLGHRHENLL